MAAADLGAILVKGDVADPVPSLDASVAAGVTE
jgi:hypothetical protein